MSDTISISLENISKVFRQYHRPVDRLKEILLPGKSRANEFWALKNINLEIPKGETVGIIGRNGSGKSTLLQIIAGTLQPTTGEVQVNGRVSALLELGSGFNPEFTGRQNVFFNGRILGLSQEEIEKRFDAIAAFADIGEFINQPVKTYSSGMFVRLAFAVAINSSPDILVIDEALSVGDEAFQRKCFSRIYAIQEAGASVLFVSHSATSIVELCNEAILIDQGEILLRGVPKAVVAQYQKFIYAPANQRGALRENLKQETYISSLDNFSSLNAESETNGNKLRHSENSNEFSTALYDPKLKPQNIVRYQSRGAKIRNIQIKTLTGESVNLLNRNECYVYSYSVYFLEDCFRVKFGLLFKTVSGLELGGAASHPAGNEIPYISAGSVINAEFKFSCILLPGTYFLNAGLVGRIDNDEVFLDRCIDVIMFKVQPETSLRANGMIDFQIEPNIFNHSLMH
ncbi:MAG: ABC transporter ATP-binding protein [Leptolyngbya sp. SIO1D8]|nr:ABC transporter ATP-binding protein [Leptolyngbya sp. SIO1D8]